MKPSINAMLAIALSAALATTSGCGLLSQTADKLLPTSESEDSPKVIPITNEAEAESTPSPTPSETLPPLPADTASLEPLPAPTTQSTLEPLPVPTDPPVAATTGALSDDLYSFQFSLNGVVYALPMPYAQFAQNGWIGDSLSQKTLKPNSLTTSDTLVNGDHKIYARFVNTAMDVLPYDQCNIGAVSVENHQTQSGIQLLLPKGITIGSPSDAVIAAYGQPTDYYDGDSLKILTYRLDTYAEIKIKLDGATGLVNGIEVENFIPKTPAQPQANTPSAGTGEVPASVTAYQAPAALGDAWNAFNVKYAGTLYHLPAPVAAFVANGWVVELGANELVAAQRSTFGIVLRKENETLRTSVHNYSDTAQPVANCFITSVLYSVWDTKIPLELPRGITESSRIEEIIAAYGQPDKTDTSANFDYYTYGTVWQRIDIVVDRETGAINRLEIEHSPDTINP